MLRSIIIGFAVALVLQFGARTAAETTNLASIWNGGTFAQVRCDGLARIVAGGLTSLTR